MERRGRRPGPGTTRDDIVVAARHAFAERGFEGATIRSIASDAGVDPATIYHFFANKDELLAAAVQLPMDPASMLGSVGAGDASETARRILATVLEVWDDELVREQLVALVRVATTRHDVGAVAQQMFEQQIISAIAALIDLPDARLRAGLIASQIAGLLLLRHVMGVAPIATMNADDVVASMAPTVERYLAGDLG